MLCIRSVCKAQLPVSVGLIQHGIQHILQKLLRRIVQRNQNAEADLPGKTGSLIRLSFPFRFIRKARCSVALFRLALTNLVLNLLHYPPGVSLVFDPVRLALYEMIGISCRLRGLPYLVVLNAVELKLKIIHLILQLCHTISKKRSLRLFLFVLLPKIYITLIVLFHAFSRTAKVQHS